MNCSKEFAYTSSTIRPVDILDVLTCFLHADWNLKDAFEFILLGFQSVWYIKIHVWHGLWYIYLQNCVRSLDGSHVGLSDFYPPSARWASKARYQGMDPNCRRPVLPDVTFLMAVFAAFRFRNVFWQFLQRFLMAVFCNRNNIGQRARAAWKVFISCRLM